MMVTHGLGIDSDVIGGFSVYGYGIEVFFALVVGIRFDFRVPEDRNCPHLRTA